MTITIHAMTCGWLTMSLKAMLAGEEGKLKVPVPSYLIRHPKGNVLFDTSMCSAILSLTNFAHYTRKIKWGRYIVRFPYHDLRMSISLAKFVPSTHDSAVSVEQLALRSGHKEVSGTIRLKISSAKQFGLIESLEDRLVRTGLGNNILHSENDISLFRQSFFNVEMYQKIISIYKNVDFPVEISKQNEIFFAFGLKKSTAHSARIAFLRSADYAEIFVPKGGKIRLFGENLLNKNTSENCQIGKKADSSNSESIDFEENLKELFEKSGRDKLVASIVAKIPRGRSWGNSEKDSWMNATRAIIDLIYTDRKDR